jgi:aspartate aminotransferase
MFDDLKQLPPDPILGIIAAYAADPNPLKIDLGIGVYKDEAGNTPMLETVVEAEKILIAEQTTKTYLGPPGVAGFNSAITDVLFGKGSAAVAEDRVFSVQTPGGTGALRVAGDVIRYTNPEAKVWASTPTWANHEALFPGAGLAMGKYPYFDAASSSLRFDEMMEALGQLGPEDVALFHACCHNPCGVSPDPDQWESIARLAADRGFLPMVDAAYVGFERGIEEDTLAIRLFTEHCPEVVVASSCSKNFALYRDRVGAISVVCSSPKQARAAESVVHHLTRKNYSMPPAHGPAIVDIILHSEDLTARWQDEVAGMRNRINGLRETLVDRIAAAGIERDFSFLTKQYGMFSFLGLDVDQVHRLRDEFSIYCVDSGRANIASFNQRNIDCFVDGLKTVLG